MTPFEPRFKSAPVTAGRILSLGEKWRVDHYSTAQDQAELMRHFNGGALIAEELEGGRSRTRRPNLLFGQKLIAKAARQLMAPYHHGLGMIDVAVRRGQTPTRRLYVQSCINKVLNDCVKKSNRLYWVYKAICGEGVQWGNSFLFRHDPYDWAPKYGRPLMDWDAPADITDDGFDEWLFPGTLQARDLITRLARLNKMPDEEHYWDKGAMRQVLERMVRRHEAGEIGGWPRILWDDDPVKMMIYFQHQPWGQEVLTSELPVYWFFNKRLEDADDLAARPIDLYCVPRYGEVSNVVGSHFEGNHLRFDTDKEDQKVNQTLFYQRAVFDNVLDCLFPFQLDMMLGGDPMMRRVIGMGHLCYDLDLQVQGGVNAIIEGTQFEAMPLFTADDTVTDEEFDVISQNGLHPFDRIPNGVAPLRREGTRTPYNHLHNITALLNDEMDMQAQVTMGGGEMRNKGRQELEIQALARQQETATVSGYRMLDWASRGDFLCKAMVGSIFNPDLLPTDISWSMRQEIAEKLEEKGVDIEEVMQGGVVGSMRRVPGHGDYGVAIQRARELLSPMLGLAPNAREEAKRMYIEALFQGEAGVAQELVPKDDTDQRQIEGAMAQNAMALSQLFPPPVMDFDVPGVHVQIHLQGLKTVLQTAVNGGRQWAAQDAQGFMALVQHTQADLQRLPQMEARAAMKVVNDLMGHARGMQVVTGEGQIDPAKRYELMLKTREQQRKEADSQRQGAQWQRTQEHREEQADQQDLFRMEDQRQSKMNNEVKRITDVAKAAATVEKARAPSNNGGS